MNEQRHCRIAGEAHPRLVGLTAGFAALREVALTGPGDAAGLGLLPAGSNASTLVVAELPTYLRWDDATRRLLRAQLERGLTLYVRGAVGAGSGRVPLPEDGRWFEVQPLDRPASIRFAHHPLVPRALIDETATVNLQHPAAARPFPGLEMLVAAKDPAARRWPVVFALQAGAGRVIFDLLDLPQDVERPIIERLSDPAERLLNLGALLAVDAIAPARPTSSFALVLDDRPTNLDYFTRANLEHFLAHLREKCPGVHLDLAWVPGQSWPDFSYVETLKRWGAGFVWHGFLRHVDHRRIAQPAAELDAGRRCVERISRRFGVRFQPVIVFPYERSAEATLQAAGAAAFMAAVESIFARPGLEDTVAPALRHTRPFYRLAAGMPALVRRYPCGLLTRERMTALAALGYPIIAGAHPRDVALRRLDPLRGRRCFAHFDAVLEFASAKKLRPLALEEIARELLDNTHERQDANGRAWSQEPAASAGVPAREAG
jgi:hypothetical protein